jgi:DNA-binding transcriptional ArsR family regulator
MSSTGGNEMDTFWRAMGDGTRRRILDLLLDGELTTGQLAETLAGERRISRYATMKHLAILERADLVVVRRRGRCRWNSLNVAPFVSLYRHYVSRFTALPGAAAYELKRFVEKEEP